MRQGVSLNLEFTVVTRSVGSEYGLFSAACRAFIHVNSQGCDHMHKVSLGGMGWYPLLTSDIKEILSYTT